jgi:hypothetical protein
MEQRLAAAKVYLSPFRDTHVEKLNWIGLELTNSHILDSSQGTTRLFLDDPNQRSSMEWIP